MASYSVSSMGVASNYLHAAHFINYLTAVDSRSTKSTQVGRLASGRLNIGSLGQKSLRVSSAAPQGIFSRITVFIVDLGDQRVALQQALPVIVESAGAQIVAYSHDLDDLAVAQDEASALAEMKKSIVDLYFLLKAERANLGPLPRKQWTSLCRLVREIE